MKLIASPGKLLVQRETAKDKTPGGIILPDAAKEKPQKGKIVGVGHGAEFDKDGSFNGVKVGQTVYFTKWAGSEIEDGDEKFVAMSVSDILAIAAD